MSMFFRTKTKNKYELKTIDLVLIVIPLFLWLVVTGQIQKIAIGDIEFEVTQALLTASEQPINQQVAYSPPTPIDDVVNVVERGMKGEMERIPQLIESKTEALEFYLEGGGYWGPAIQEYFESLAAASYFKYAVINNPDGSFFGMFKANQILDYFKDYRYDRYNQFARFLNTGNAGEIEQIPGFISNYKSVTNNENKRSVLQRMEQINMDVLPVIDDNRRFVGVVEQSRLTASMMIDVIDTLQGK